MDVKKYQCFNMWKLGSSSTLPHGALIHINLTPLGFTLHILFPPNMRGHFMFLGLTFLCELLHFHNDLSFVLCTMNRILVVRYGIFFCHFIMQNKALKWEALPKSNVCLQLLPLSTPSKLSSCSQNLVMTPFIGLTYEGGFSRKYFSNQIGYHW